ncbi:hypothetical protein JW877_05920 [bacterium]|nr:hypothetical protein [bacterium]
MLKKCLGSLAITFVLILFALWMMNCGEETNGPVEVEYVPAINTLIATPFILEAGDTSVLRADVSYGGASALVYNWSASSGAITSYDSTAIWIAPAEMGTHTIELVVTGGNHSATARVNVHVAEGEETVPIITTIVASPTEIATAGTTRVIANIAYNGDAGLDYTWFADSGSIVGDGSEVSWIAPYTEGNYIIELTVSNGIYFSEGMVGVSVNSPEVGPTFTLMGEVLDHLGHPLGNAWVWTAADNYDLTSPGGSYALSSETMPVDLSFYKAGYTALTLFGMERDFSPELMTICVSPVRYNVTIKAHTITGFHPLSNIYIQAFSSANQSSGVVSVPHDSLMPWDTLTFTLENLPGDTSYHFYIVASNTEQTLTAMTDAVYLNSDTTVYLMCYTLKSDLTINVNIGTLPTGLIDYYRVVAWVDSAYVDTSYNNVIGQGQIIMGNLWGLVEPPDPFENILSFNFCEPIVYNVQSNLASPLDAKYRQYNITVEAYDRWGNSVKRVIRDIGTSTDHLQVNFSGMFPDAELDSISSDGRPFISWMGEYDLYRLVICGDGTGMPNAPIWEGLTQMTYLAFPEEPATLNILPPGDYFFYLHAYRIPGFDINDNFDFRNLLETGLSDEDPLGLGRRRPAYGNQSFTITK